MELDIMGPDATPRSTGFPGLTSIPDFGVDPALLPSGGAVPPFMASNSTVTSGARPGGPAPGTPVTLNGPQRAAADALRLALDEGHVYAGLTGAAGVGKTTALEAVLAEGRELRVLRIAQPDAVTGELAARIESIALAQAAKLGVDQHVALVVDDAHTASVELLDSLARLATARRAGGRMPQVLLVGEPMLWDRLKAERFKQLERRIAMRHELIAASDEDPWASVEQALAPARDKMAGAPPQAAVPAGAQPKPATGFDDVMARIGKVEVEEKRRSSGVLVTLLALLVMAAAASGAAAWFGWLPPGLLPGGLLQRTAGNAPVAPNSTIAPPPATGSGPVSAAPVPRPPATVAPPAIPPNAPASIAPTLQAPAVAPAPPPAEPRPVPATVVAQPVPPVAPTQPTSPPPVASTAPPVAPARMPAASPPAASISSEMVALMIRRGEERMALGDITAARSFFERAAAGGNGLAAFLAGRTYDPAFLLPESESMADTRQAASWYRRAAAGGNQDAAARLQQLGGADR